MKKIIIKKPKKTIKEKEKEEFRGKIPVPIKKVNRKENKEIDENKSDIVFIL